MYKKSEEALAKSEKNKANATKKKYHHNMGPGGYALAMPKWDKLESDMLSKGINPEPYKWVDRARNWFYGHGGTLDSEGCFFNYSLKFNGVLHAYAFPVLGASTHGWLRWGVRVALEKKL